MKFLVIQRAKDSWFALPPEKLAEITGKTKAMRDKYRKNGKNENQWVFADTSGNAGTWNVDSSEEMMRLVCESPLSPYVKYEVIPIVDSEAAEKIIKDLMAAAQKK